MKTLPPWKAFLGLILCLLMAVWVYHLKYFSQACALSVVAGMFLQDWGYRLRDKHDPERKL